MATKLYEMAMAAMLAGDWDQQVKYLENVLLFAPDYPSARRHYRHAQHWQRIETLYQVARQCMFEGRWGGGLWLLRWVEHDAGPYRDTAILIGTCRRRLRYAAQHAGQPAIALPALNSGTAMAAGTLTLLVCIAGLYAAMNMSQATSSVSPMTPSGDTLVQAGETAAPQPTILDLSPTPTIAPSPVVETTPTRAGSPSRTTAAPTNQRPRATPTRTPAPRRTATPVVPIVPQAATAVPQPDTAPATPAQSTSAPVITEPSPTRAGVLGLSPAAREPSAATGTPPVAAEATPSPTPAPTPAATVVPPVITSQVRTVLVSAWGGHVKPSTVPLSGGERVALMLVNRGVKAHTWAVMTGTGRAVLLRLSASPGQSASGEFTVLAGGLYRIVCEAPCR